MPNFFSVQICFQIAYALHEIWHRDSKSDTDSFFGSKSGFGDDFGQSDTRTIILCRFLAKRLLEIALQWQHLKSQVIKNYLKGCVIR